MKHAEPVDPKTQLAEMISSKLEEQGKTMKDLAEAVDTTYEHIRRVARGEGLPSKYVLQLICKELDIPYDEALKLATVDKITKKYGGIPAEISGKDPSLEPVERVWKKLNPEQRGALVDMANSFAKRNRKAS